MQVANQILVFYGWWELSTCFFAFVALIGIWYHIGRKQNDFGQVWLALSILCWSISGAVEILHVNDFILNSNSQIQIEGWRSILSLFNSLFILLALPWFQYLPKKFEPLIKSSYWKFIVGLPFLFSLLPTISKMYSGNSYAIMNELDVYYSVLTLGFLGVVLWTSFSKRKLHILAWLSIVFIIITFIAQLFKFSDSATDMLLFSAIFKTSLIMIFFALALSWVKEIAEIIIPASKNIKIEFSKNKTESGRYEHQVILNGINAAEENHITLSPSLYELLLKFAERKKSNSDDWLEIKPKGDQRGKEYDINDYNEIKRILQRLLDGLFGKDNWTKNKHELPLKLALFEMSEKRERKIRLAIPSENIILK